MVWNKGIKVDRIKYPNMGHFNKHSDKTKKIIGNKNSLALKGKIPKNLYLINANKSGSGNPMWNGGRTITPFGYNKILVHNHPNADKKGYYYEHKLVMEKFLGRYLTKVETVHHIDGNKLNNNINNLELFNNTGEHSKFHRDKDKWKFSKKEDNIDKCINLKR